MSTKLFYRSTDRLYISSYRKANIRALAEHCIADINKLSNYLHKIAQLRFYLLQYSFIHILYGKQIQVPYINETNVLCLRYFINMIHVDSVLFSTFYKYHVSNLHNIDVFVYYTYGTFIGYYAICVELYKFALFYKKGLCSLPTKTSRYTVLRSPHTDKKSREQFERRTHRKVYMFPSIMAEYYAFLCESHYVYMYCTVVHEYNKVCYE